MSTPDHAEDAEPTRSLPEPRADEFGVAAPSHRLIGLQRTIGNRATAQLMRSRNHPPRSAPRGVQRDAMGDLYERDRGVFDAMLELTSAVNALRRSVPNPTDAQRRRIEQVDRSFAAMEASGFAAPMVVAWWRSVMRARSSLYNESLQVQSDAVIQAGGVLQRQPAMRAVFQNERQERRQTERAEDSARATREIRAHLRQNWASVRAAPTVHLVQLNAILERRVGDDERVSAYLEQLASSEPQLARFLTIMRRNPRAVEQDTDIMRGVALAIGGEWADIVAPASGEFGSADRLAVRELAGDGEADWQAEVVGTVADTAITSFPILDQVGDLRDFGAHAYALLDVDGRRPNEIRSPMRWFGIVTSGVGLVPTLGSWLKGSSGIVRRAVARVGDALGPIVRRSVEPIMRFLARYAPDFLPLLRRMLDHVSNRWSSIADVVRGGWSRAAGRVRGILDNVVLRATEFGRGLARRWESVRAATNRMLDPALERVRALLEPVLDAVRSAVRRAGSSALSQALRRRVAATTERLSAVAGEVGRRASDLRDLVSTPTARMERLDASLEELSSLERRLAEAVQNNDSDAVEALTAEAERVAADAERRLTRAAGADVGQPDGAGSVEAPAVEAQRPRGDTGDRLTAADGAGAAEAASPAPIPDRGVGRPGHTPDGQPSTLTPAEQTSATGELVGDASDTGRGRRETAPEPGSPDALEDADTSPMITLPFVDWPQALGVEGIQTDTGWIVRPPGSGMDRAAAEALYHRARQLDPSIEVGLFRHPQDGSYLVIQGSADSVSDSEARLAGGWLYGETSPWASSPGVSVRHSHPVQPGSGMTAQPHLAPSGATPGIRDGIDRAAGDFARAAHDSRRSGWRPIESAIDVETPWGSQTIRYGYDPTRSEPIWLHLPGEDEPHGFRDMEEFHVWYQDRFGTSAAWPVSGDFHGPIGPHSTTPEDVFPDGTPASLSDEAMADLGLNPDGTPLGLSDEAMADMGLNPDGTSMRRAMMERTLERAHNSQIEELISMLQANGIDLAATEFGRDLREALRTEKARRGSRARWEVP